jgi:hypothetical protein
MKALESDHEKPAPASMPSGFEPDVVAKISRSLTTLLADQFALYVKAKNFHWRRPSFTYLTSLRSRQQHRDWSP